MTSRTASPSPAYFDDPIGFTPSWLAAALATCGIDVEIDAVAAVRVGTGQIGASYRLTIDYAEPAAAKAAGAPATLVAKMAGGDPESRTLVADGFRNEFGFYTEIASTVAVNTPRCWYAAIADDNIEFILLMDDLAPAEPGVQVNGCSRPECELAVVNLAGLHGPRWNDPALLNIDWMRRADRDSAEFFSQVLAGAIPTFIERFGERMVPGDAELIATIPSRIADWQLTRPERFSITHGDYRPDNLMFMPDGSSVSTVDWQTLGIGLPGRDIGYFLATSVEPEIRRTSERELVARYHEALLSHGVVGHSFDECFEDYRLGVVQGPLITILGAVYATAEPTPASDAMFLAMITRSCAAIRDLDPFSLL
jgi:hypothetical protein